MKKIFIIATAFFLTTTIQAQKIADHAIGLRLGGNRLFGSEITYQRAMGDKNRLEADLGIYRSNSTHTTQLAGIYQWVWKIESSFHWYAGPGAGVGTWRYLDNYIWAPTTQTQFFAFIAGNIGVEYDFDFPLLVSLDFRPQIGIINYGNNNNFDIALSARYQF
ncbi:MAG: hypothetical protein H6584_04365 [Flavobacteriales bacterium]|nr:hypothetical protein [Flavobacteriales bacterium]